MKLRHLFFPSLLSVLLYSSLPSAAQTSVDSIPVADSIPVETESYDQEAFTDLTTSSSAEANSRDIWRYNKRFMLGFTTGTLDRKIRFGGKISSRWGLSMASGRNISLHRKPIAGMLKFGLNLGVELNYMNLAKGSGSISDLVNPGNYIDSETLPNFGQHYLTAGIAIGPTATVAPFYASSNAALAALRFRPYFNLTPSFATYIVSDEDDIDMHNAFALWYGAGMEIQWKRLVVGLGWKGSVAKYKGLVDNILNESESTDSYKFDTNMFNILIGIAF